MSDATAGNARTEILGRIRRALGDRSDSVTAPRDYHRTLDPGTDVVDLFAQRAADYRAAIHRTDSAGLPAAIAAAAAGRRLVVPAGVPPGWTTGLDTVTDEPPLSNSQLDATGGALTGAAVAIALTGTIILDAAPDQGRRAITLLPDLHLCVVRADQIVGTVAEALARLDAIRPLTWISGPSATSDIELNRIEGVHGPRNLHIFVVA
jgi:L-lactate dehydrogenase complex protein LldG